MKRDMELVRGILQAVEAGEHTPQGWVKVEVPGYDTEQVYYHIMLLHEAGLLEGCDLRAFGSNQWAAKRLTWAGHDFIDAARNDAVWRKAKEKAAEMGGSVALDIFKELLVLYAKQMLGLAA